MKRGRFVFCRLRPGPLPPRGQPFRRGGTRIPVHYARGVDLSGVALRAECLREVLGSEQRF
jgi:hypothetical protein